ncbi:GIY-YIG nuclease family protein [Acetobacter orientalis]|uniref:GIY-YIG nuclease family protein n=1 Tax=Acetobacter TaxID=434 RepID=UPI000A36B7D9|nr:GIY-YIG nuclease family protein [Acetobacter orientalis]
MERLLKIGFRKIGSWSLIDNYLTLQTMDFAPHGNALYVFVADGIPMYVGKTTRGIQKRLREYVKPGLTQSTNIRNKGLLEKTLNAGKSIEIFFLPDDGLVQYGDFIFNVAAALEDSIIQVLAPPWNGGKKENEFIGVKKQNLVGQAIATAGVDVADSMLPLEIPSQASFELKLYKAYYQSGFFNVGVSHAKLFGNDGEKLTIFLGNSRVPVQGSINRTANKNGSPRLMGYTKTRDWLRENIGLNNYFTVRVLSPISINIVCCSHLLVS